MHTTIDYRDSTIACLVDVDGYVRIWDDTTKRYTLCGVTRTMRRRARVQANDESKRFVAVSR